jgi:hypothetical protein
MESTPLVPFFFGSLLVDAAVLVIDLFSGLLGFAGGLFK